MKPIRTCLLLGLVFLAVILPSTALADTITCESAEIIPEGYKAVANSLLKATSGLREVVHAQQVVYVEIENQNALPGPVALRIRGAKRLDGNGAGSGAYLGK